MNFKFFNNDNEYSFLRLEPMQQLTLTRFQPDNIEFCFQFGDNEPVVFATGPNECQINLSPQTDSSMTFTDNERKFKLFARERQNG
jgi:hypothetical protein